MRRFAAFLGCVVVLVLASGQGVSQPPAPKKLKLLFLGDKGAHQPELRFRQIEPVLAARGIEVVYSNAVSSLNTDNLNRYDGLMIYANTTKISPEQEKALLDYVAGGKALIPLHCASYAFQNSPKYIALVGAQFKSHGTGTFRTEIAEPDHPLMKGFKGFESWDETYVHTKHNEQDRTVLEYRVDGKVKEPWTWVRTHGKGRVFYTAWGHDQRTWGNPGFQDLLTRGIRWAVGDEPAQSTEQFKIPKMIPQRTDLKPFEYVDGKMAFYPPKGMGSGKPLNKVQVALSALESAKHMVFPDDFDLQLYASDPDIKRPICMNWDERGRLWIAETVDYPNSIQPKGQGHDRIVILEDTKGTGKADKFTVFADNLSIPASMAFHNGGVIVHQIPQTLFLKSSKGDDKADIRETLISGWRTNDTHAGPSNLRYGLDNWFWGIVGYAGYKGTVGGENLGFSQAFYRFKGDASKMEFIRNTNNNSWGVGISEEGLIFGSTANGNPSVYMPIANRYYEKVRGWSPGGPLKGIAGNPKFNPIVEKDKVRQVDYHGAFTAAAGHALYTARLYPSYYWNRTAFVAEPTGHLVATFELQRIGSDFKSKPSWNLLASDDEWTAPIMAEVGPDGCVWIIDWYNIIVQHNPTPAGFKTGKGAAYETELRDKTHGRIYRLVPKNKKLPPPVSLKDATPEKLVATLKNDNMFWRLHAQRLLVERGKQDVLPALAELSADPSVDSIGLNTAAIHALWTMHGLGAFERKEAKLPKEENEGESPRMASQATFNQVGADVAALVALKHKSPGVRRNALLVLPRTTQSVEAILSANILDDADAHVRLAALLALSEMPPSPKAGPAIAEILMRPENNRDRWIADAVTAAAARHDVAFLKAVATKKYEHVQKTLDTVGIVAEHHARGGKADALDDLLQAFSDAQPNIAEIFVARIAKGWPRSQAVHLKPETEKSLQKLMNRVSAAGQGQLLRLAASWGVKDLEKQIGDIAKTLLGTVINEKESDAARAAAAKQLLEMRGGDAEVVDKLLGIITPRTSPQLANDILAAMAENSSPAIGPAVTKRLPTLTPAARAAALRVLLSRPESIQLLLDAMDKGQVQISELALDQRQSLLTNVNKKIAARAKTILERGGSLPDADRQKVIDDILPLLQKTGDVPMGKAVFTKNCGNCHQHGGEGTNIGPDLTGMAVHPKHELLIHILDPSRNVEGNFRLYNVTLHDGRQINGMLAAETKTTIDLIDSEAKKHTLLREDVDSIVVTTKSMMPEGFEKTLQPQELVNLMEFLTVRGQFIGLPLAKAATAVTTKGMFNSLDNKTERLILPNWGPKTVKGVPFQLVDPQGEKTPNAILLYGPQGKIPPTMPKSVKVICNTPAKAIHLLSGVSGWGYPYSQNKDVVMIVRLHYADGKTEDHALKNGEHFADYISRNDVPGSEFAFAMRNQQMRYLAIQPKREESIAEIEFVKGPDNSAPIVLAVTVETKGN